jgi:uncharacterized protein involved in outer membrane biogenesis
MSTMKPASNRTTQPKRRRRRRATLGIGLVAIVAVVLGLLLLVIIVVDEAVLPARFEQTASEALGMEVSMAGAVNLRFWPNPHIHARQVSVSSDNSRVADFESVRLHIAIAPLFRGVARIRHVRLADGQILIVRDMDGRLNVQPREPDLDPEVTMPSFAFANASMIFIDERAETRSELATCDGRLHHMARAEGDAPEGLAGLEFEGNLQCESIGHDDLIFHDVAMVMRAEGGRFEFDPISLTTFGGAGEARFEADFSGDTPGVDFEITLDEFHLDAFLKLLQDDAQAEGTMHFAASLSASGENPAAMWHALEGDISLHGRELKLHGIDVDQRVSDYGDTQAFNLLDVGAVLFAGPVGLAFTKATNYAQLLTADNGSTEFREAVSHWKLSNGVATAIDVAAATEKNRFAAYGTINFAERTFDGLEVALLDRHGCAAIEQAVTGSFSEPKIEQLSGVETLLGPLIDLVERGIEALTDEECEVVYDGIIDAP